MAEFDALLQKALMDANWEQYRSLCESAEEPQCSPQYLRQGMKLLADPFAWAKKQARPMWKRALRTAACLLLASAVTLGGLMAVSPAVRAAVLSWLREVSGRHLVYVSQGDGREYEEPPRWRLTTLPEGWALDGVSTVGTRNHDACGWTYRRGEETLQFSCWYPVSAHVGTALGTKDVETAYHPAAVGDRPADFYRDESGNLLVWEGSDGTLLKLEGTLEQAALEQIAAGVTETQTEALPDYRLDWLPEGSGEPYARSVLREAVREQWTTADGVICDWMYAAESVCPLAVPENAPEPVLVNGADGWYWAADPGGAGDIQITTGSTGETWTLSGRKQEAVLLWTESSITFRINGALEKEEMLRIAEGISLQK